MTKKQKDAIRTHLATPTLSKGGRTSGVPAFFEANPIALEVAEAWLEMKGTGESDWSLVRLHRLLVNRHGFPYKSEGSLKKWFKRNYGPLFDQAMARG